MDANDKSYMEFLRIYFPETADSVTALQALSPKGDTPEEIKKSTAEIEEKINSAVNKAECVSEYNAYLTIPQSIRSRYSGTKVPPDVMEAARRNETLTLMEWEQHPELKQVEDVRERVREKYDIPNGVELPAVTSAVALTLFATALKSGYSQEASRDLALQSQYRENLLEEKSSILTNPNLSEAEKREKLKDWFENKWLKSRRDTIKTIKEDWKGAEGKEAAQPEKYIVRLLAKYSRGHISEEKLLPLLADMMDTVKRNNRQDSLLEYLKKDNIQAKIGHFNNKARDLLATLVLERLPEAEREQFLARDFRKKRGLRVEISDDQKAMVVAKDIKQAKANAIPNEPTLTTEEKRANVPTTLMRGIQREE